jgi:hypothetical protein
MGKYFGSTKYKSFQRTLNLWGFQVRDNKQIANEHFVRGMVHLCSRMQRVKVKGAFMRRLIRKPDDYDDEDDAVTQASSQSPPTIVRESNDANRLRRDDPHVAAGGNVPLPLMLPQNEVGVVPRSNDVVSAFPSSPRSASAFVEVLASNSDKRALLSLMMVDRQNRRYQQELLGNMLCHQQLMATPAAIVRGTGGGSGYINDPSSAPSPRRSFDALEKIAVLANINSRMLRQHHQDHYTIPASLVPVPGLRHTLGGMASGTPHEDVSSPQRTIIDRDDGWQRWMAARGAAAAALILSMAPQHTG